MTEEEEEKEKVDDDDDDTNKDQQEEEWISGDELELFERATAWEDASKNGSLSKLLSAAEFGNAQAATEALREIEDEFVNAKGEDGIRAYTWRVCMDT